MRPTWRTGWWLFLIVTLALGLTPRVARAADQLLFGPIQYTRTSGPPNQFMETIPLPPTLVAPFHLHIQNGNPDGSHRLSSATITINGTQVAGPSDFSQQVAAFDRAVTLQANNTLQVRLTSTPGGFLILSLYGSVPLPTLSSLAPPTLPLTQGATGTLTATLSAVQATDTVIALQSSHTAIATVPATVTVPAHALTAAIPVTAHAPGTATITATLNESNGQATVTVQPSGPTLTGLIPATLQITQGAAGSLTVTLNAVQPTDTLVTLTSSPAGVVGLPATVTVPAGQGSQAFAVFGTTAGAATVTATLNGSTAQSHVTVVLPLPTVVSLLPPALPLTEGSTGTLTVTLSASQPTDTDVLLTTSDGTVAGLAADRVTVPAHALAASFSVTGLTHGMATVTASLNGSTATSAVTVTPPPAMLHAFTCPATLTIGATGLCTLTLTATQLTDTVVPLASSDPGVVTVPTSGTIPANTLAVQIVVTGTGLGSATLTAGPLNGTSQTADLQVVPPPPTLASLLPPSGTLYVGATATLTLTLNAAQLTDTVVPLGASPSTILNLPVSITIPAGSLTAPVTVTGLIPGTATLTAGPLNGTQAQSTLTVNQLPPTLTSLAPASLSLPKGTIGSLTLTIAPTQSTATVVPLASSDPTTVEVPPSLTIPAGASAATLPVLTRNVGTAMLTAGPLNGSSLTVPVTVTAPELVGLTITPPAPAIAKGETQAFTVTGTYTDGTTQDLTSTATWTSSDETIATIASPGGLATSHAEGQVTLTATVGALTAIASLTVTAPILQSLAVAPEAPTRRVGETLQFQAIGTLSDGTTQDLTAAVTWTSSSPTVATITASGLVTALSVGSTTLTAAHPEGLTANTTLTVLLPLPTLAGLSPASLSLPKGTTGTLTLTITPAQPTATTVPLSASPSALLGLPSSVTVPAGATTTPIALTALAQGTATLTAGPLNGTSQAATVNVTAPALVALAVTPAAASIPKGRTQAFTATGTYTDASTQDLTVSLTWSSSDPAIASISAAGLAIGQALGQVTITAAQGAVSSTAALTVTAPILANLAIAPTAPSRNVGETVQFAATGTLSDSTTQDLTSVVTWTSSAPAIAAISATGLATGLAQGSTTITATHPSGLTASTTLTVILPPPTLTGLTPATLSLAKGRVGTFTVAIAPAQPTVTVVPLGANPSAILGLPASVTVPANTQTATFAVTALAQGTAILTAGPLNGTNRTASVTVTPPELVSVSVTPLTASIPKGRQQPFTATGTYTDGSLLDLTASVLWTSSDPGVAAIGVGGLATGLTLGSVTITATVGIVTASATLTVSAPVLASLAIAPVTPTVVVGQTLQLTATGTLTDATTQDLTTVVAWTSSDATLATVTASGLVTGMAAGTPTITATHASGLTASVPLNVIPPPTLVGVTPASGTQGASLNVTVQGSTTHFAGGSTTLTFGPNLSVAGASEGNLGPATVIDPVTAGVLLAINPTAALGPRIVTAQTGTETATLPDGFSVLPVTPPAIAGTSVSTLAGSGIAGAQDAQGALAQFHTPQGLALAKDGTVYLADTGNHLIRRIASDGTVTTVAGTGTPGFTNGASVTAQFSSPQGVALGTDGTLYVADTGNHSIRRIATDGTVTTLAGTGIAGYQDGTGTGAQFANPRSLVLRADGVLIVGDTGNGRLRTVNPTDGTVATLAGSGTPGFLDGPAATAQFGSLAGLALDAAGILSIADSANQRIRTLDLAGNVTTLAGDGSFGFRDGPAAQARFADPTGVAVDAAGIVYVADTFNSLIRRIATNGTVVTLAGTGTRSLTDGPGTTAMLNTPQALRADGQGRLVVSDTGNHVIRLLQIAPTVTGLSPVSGAQGQTVTLTVTGTGLAGATTLSFLLDGTADATISVTNIQVNVAGTELQASVTIAPLAALGSRLVTVATPGGTSDATASSANTFTVLGQLTLAPSILGLIEGQGGTLTIQLSAPAPAGGLTLTLESATPSIAAVPASVTVAAGATSASATVTGVLEGTTTLTATATGFAPGHATVAVSAPLPTLRNFSPSSAKVGAAIVLAGTGFRLTPSANTVRFTAGSGWVAAPVTAATATTLTVTVPSSATTGPLQLTTSGGTVTSTGVFIVLPTLDVSLTVEPSPILAIAGTSVSLKVSTTATGGFTGLTTLSTGTLPDGVTATFSTPALGPNTFGILTLTPSASTPSPSTITVVGTTTIDGTLVTKTSTATLTLQPAGQTSLTGQVLDEDANPLPGVTVRIASTQTTTDAAGNFLLGGLTAGAGQVLFIDGTSASTSDRQYPIIPYKVTLVAGQATPLGFTPYLHRQKTTGMVNIATTSVQRVVADPALPGFAMTLPAGVAITGWDGQLNTQVSVRQVPLDRNPLPPLPADRVVRSLYMDYFGKAGGGTPSAPVPITFPNDLGLPPGTQVELWYFDEAPDGSRPNAWAQYGTGTVTADGSQVMPNTDPSTGKPYGQPRFCCGAAYVAKKKAEEAAANAARGGSSTGAAGTGAKAGEPVDLSTGIFTLQNTDLVVPGRMPLALTRTYHTNGSSGGPFGPGTSHPYHVLLLVESNLRTLLLPNGGRVAFPLQTDGTFRNSTDPSMRGTVLSEASGFATLRWKDGSVWTFGMPAYGIAYLSGQRDRTGNALAITRDDMQNVTAVTDAMGRQLLVTVDANNHITAITDPLGRTVQYAYDAGGRLSTVTNPAGGITRYTYDTNNRLLTITDPRSITFLTNEYDANGRVVRQTQADGGIWTFTYTVSANVVTQTVVTDPRGNSTTTRFNGQGYTLSTTDALGQTTTVTRDPATNLLLATTDPLGRSTRFTYDPNGNVLTVTDPLGQTRTVTYDATFNQVTSITDPLGNLTTFEYDATGNLTAVTDPVQNTQPVATRVKTTLTYNTLGQPLTVTDPLGDTTTLTYDSVGNLRTSQDPLGNSSQRTYDIVSRLLTQTDPLGSVTQFTYDLLNRLIGSIDPLNGQTQFTYDPNGNLLTVTDAQGNTVTHEYDSMDRVNRRIDPLGKAETFQYDGNGNLVSTTDRKNQTTSVTYDAVNRRIRTDFADGASVSVAYDAAGNLLTTADTGAGPLTFTYDALDRLVSETGGQGTVTYAYDSLSRRQAMLASGLQSVTYGYDANSRLTGLTQGTQSTALAYDAANRRTTLTLPNGIVLSYSYDAASRLIGQTYTGSTGVLGDLTYGYDPTGNRVATGGSFARSGLPISIPATNYDAANRQLTFGSAAQTFDANGNLLTQADATGTTTYTWDARNRLTTLTGPTVSAAFAYDALGRRTTKTINGQSSSVLYDGLDAVQESGPDGDASYLRTLGIDEALSRTDANGTLTYLSDALGSTLALADSGGGFSTTYTYAPFGETTVTGLPSASPFQFTGRENDGTGLYYYRARYYDPGRSRFVSEDPIGLAGGLNLYAYISNGPSSGIDPLGLRKVIMTITGYDNGFNSTQKNPGDPGYGMTKNNTVAGPGTIAADPSWYPFGTRMDIPGYGPGVVQDSGGRFRNRPSRIDLWFPSEEAANRWGKRTLEVEVYDGMPNTCGPVPDVLRKNILGRRKDSASDWPQFPAPWAP